MTALEAGSVPLGGASVLDARLPAQRLTLGYLVSRVISASSSVRAPGGR